MGEWSGSAQIGLVDGSVPCVLRWRDRGSFDAATVVITLYHDEGTDLAEAIASVSEQVDSGSVCQLIVTERPFEEVATSVGGRPHRHHVVLAEIPSCTVAQARNLSHQIAWGQFPAMEWMCRLDADDVLAGPTSLQDALEQLRLLDDDKWWALAGNTLREGQAILDRVNLADSTLGDPDGVLERLRLMREGDPLGELPSCNLWLRRGVRLYYPDIGSGEDHWLVARLLLLHSDEGVLLHDVLHAQYTLSGGITQSNRSDGRFEASRRLLHDSALRWIGRLTHPGDRTCLGWGAEGIVWLDGDTVTKRFHSLALTDDHVEWLASVRGLPAPEAAWAIREGRWEASYRYYETEPPGEVSLANVSRFIQSCLAAGVVFLNIKRRNFRLHDGALHCVDIGWHVRPLEVRYFRDMCVRLYLTFVQDVNGRELASRTMEFRNELSAMASIEGFEQFYQRELQLFAYSSGVFAKPRRDVPAPKRHHSDVTLLIKACAMESETIGHQVEHITHQLGRHDTFASTVLLIDPRQGAFIRQHREGDIESLLAAASELERLGLVDEVWVAPNEQAALVSSTLAAWFGHATAETHTMSGVPLFPQVWAFDRIRTRYVLQLDADVLIGREEDDDVVGRMLEALSVERVFGVGFNIPQPEGSSFAEYDAPDGAFVPEVRLGLLDLNRLRDQRPFPNPIEHANYTKGWYRAVESYQQANGWRSLRGGDPRSWYIHPMNTAKRDPAFMDRVTDLVESGLVPAVQLGAWDLVEDRVAWQHPELDSPLVFVVDASSGTPHWVRGALRSLIHQSDRRWSAIVHCNVEDLGFARWLATTEEVQDPRVTLLRTRYAASDASTVRRHLRATCTGSDPFVFPLGPKEVLMDRGAVGRLLAAARDKTDAIITYTHLSSRPLGVPRGDVFYVGDEWNAPSAVRAVRLSALDRTGFAMQTSGALQTDLLLSETDSVARVEQYAVFDGEVTGPHQERVELRPTTYIPNLRRLEIDITYFCNLACAGCSRSSAQAPTKQHMPVEMIQGFLEESAERGLEWESLHLLGGEPTLHPEFERIITLLDTWFAEHSPETDLKVITNGYGTKVQSRITALPSKWRYENSYKPDRDTSHFDPFNVAPVDLEDWRDEDFTKACYIPQDSGVALTPYGYFHCAVAGGIERIAPQGLGMASLPDHPWEFIEQMRAYCGQCGLFLRDTFQARSEHSASFTPETMSQFWEAAYASWRVSGDA